MNFVLRMTVLIVVGMRLGQFAGQYFVLFSPFPLFRSVVGKMDEELETYKVECSNLQSVLMEQAENPDSKKEGIVCSNTADA